MEEIKFKKSKLGMKGRIMVIVIPLIILAIGATTFFTFSRSKQVIMTRTLEIVEQSAAANANEIDKILGGALKQLYIYKLSILDGRMTKMQLSRMLKSTYQTSELYPNGLYYADSLGSWIDGSGWVPAPDYVAVQEEWFKEGMTHTDSFELGKPYIDEMAEQYVVTASVNISDATADKVLAADIPLNALTDYVKTVTFFDGKGGTLLITPDNESIIAASTMNDSGEIAVSKEIQKLYDKVCDKEFLNTMETAMKVKIAGKSYYLASQELEGCDWRLISYVSDEDAVQSELNSAFSAVAILAFIIILVSIVIIDIFIHHKIKQIKIVTKSIEDITNGDFTGSMKVKSHDETGVMTNSLQIFLVRMQGMLRVLKQMASQLTEQSHTSMSMSRELATASTSQHLAMEDMIHTLGQLNNSVEEVAEGSTSLAGNVSETNLRCKKANEVLIETVDFTNEGIKEMNELSVSMQKLQITILELGKAVQDVGENMKNIEQMVNVIGDISSQTNLLSLNASIEAARAGEAGKGFAVVAQEIGKLADNSSGSVSDIKQITDGISQLVSDMGLKMEASMASIQTYGSVVEKTSLTFNNINTRIIDTKEEVLSIIESVAELDTISQSLAAITEEQSASSEEMLSASEDVLEHSGKVKENAGAGEDAADKLLHIVKELDELMKFFKY